MNDIGKQLTILPEIDSTNNYAARCITDGTATHGQAFLALKQTQGKGQRGRVWQGGEGNIALSIVLDCSSLPLNQAFLLQMMIAGSVAHTLNQLQEGFKIKWPNDIFYNDRKAAGILIENKINGQQWQYAIVGIGINVNDTNIHQLSPLATSLIQILKTPTDVIQLTQQLLQNINTAWQQFITDSKIAAVQYNKLLYKKGETITLLQNNHTIHTILNEVDDSGRIICGALKDEYYTHGEVTWVNEV